MKIRTKIVFLVISVITFFITASLISTIYTIDERGQEEIEEFEKTEKLKIENNLKSFVDLAYSVIETNHKNATDKNYLQAYYGQHLNDVMDIVSSMLNDKIEDVKKGRISKQQAQKQALDFIQKTNYDNGIGYFWITDNQKPFPKMIFEPIVSNLNNQILNSENFNNARGTNANPFVVSVAMCDTAGEGYVDYSWYRPTQKNEEMLEKAKFSYVRAFKEWNWIIGTGIYIEDAMKDAMEKTKEDIRQMSYDNGTGYYWINDDQKPTPMLIMNANWKAGEGKVHTDKRFNCANGTDQNLYQAFLEACEKKGHGSVEYVWDKPVKGGETIENAPKSSYVKYFKPFGWIIGSGVYTDDVDRIIETKKEVMEARKKDLMISSVVISIPLATLSIIFLIWMMNKHFRESSENNTSEEEGEENILLSDKEEEKNKEVVQTESGELSSNYILQTFIKEQSKLMAFNKLVDVAVNKEPSSLPMAEISKDIKELTSELKENIREIKKMHKNK